MTGRFLTLEGIDGAGKSTHLAGAVERLRASGLEVVLTREPGGSPLAEDLREWLLNRAMAPQTELLLMFAARADHLDQLIRPALARGAWVVCDRFTDSTLAYQGGGRGLDQALIRALAKTVHGDCEPDRTYYFDLDAETAERRRLASRDADRFEAEQRAFFDRVRGAYQAIAKEQPERVLTLDSAQSLAAVQARLYADLDDQMARYGG
ncbi:MAG: dTMP kinase [Burkholderiaceae bacterium]